MGVEIYIYMWTCGYNYGYVIMDVQLWVDVCMCDHHLGGGRLSFRMRAGWPGSAGRSIAGVAMRCISCHVSEGVDGVL